MAKTQDNEIFRKASSIYARCKGGDFCTPIAEAIMEERENCARLVEDYGNPSLAMRIRMGEQNG